MDSIDRTKPGWGRFTVVGRYVPDEAGTFVEHVVADDPADAVAEAARKLEVEQGEAEIVAVFQGHLMDLYEEA